MARRFVNLTGETFGLLTVLCAFGKNSTKEIIWHCVCECGNTKNAKTSHLTSGKIKSCGCIGMIKKELIGKTFGMVTVIRMEGNDTNNELLWGCQCDCGKYFIKRGSDIRKGRIKSCGCILLAKDANTPIKKKLYSVWGGMKARCLNPKAVGYNNYGGRGIQICNQWSESFTNFFEDMAPTFRPGLTIERINNDGHYTKNNCKWATRAEQQKNKRKRLPYSKSF